jgi:hypothetical protein
MSAAPVQQRPAVTVTSWDFVKDNYDPNDRLAVVIKNLSKDRFIQRIDAARNIASPDFQKWLRFHNVNGGCVYLSTNSLRPEATGRTRADIHAIRHVYLDIDGDGPRVLENVLSDIRIPKPNYVLNTSPGKYQTLWKVQDFSIGQAESLQRIMAADFGADQAVVDAARVLRIPGFYNKKYEERHQVTAKRLSDETYRPAHFRINTPEFASEPSSLSRTATAKASSTHPKSEGHISQSERDWAYAKRRLSMGADPEEVIQAITEYRPDKWKSEAYARRTVEKALAELNSGVTFEDNCRSVVDR